jgi:hypothetical protein
MMTSVARVLPQFRRNAPGVPLPAILDRDKVLLRIMRWLVRHIACWPTALGHKPVGHAPLAASASAAFCFSNSRWRLLGLGDLSSVVFQRAAVTLFDVCPRRRFGRARVSRSIPVARGRSEHT